MKNIIKTILITFALVGCEDYIELTPKGAPTSTNFWKSEADVTAATNGLYLMNDFQGVYGRGIHLYSLMPSDDFVVGKSKGQIEDIKNFYTPGSGSYTRDIWPMHFIVVKRANDIIKNVTDLDIDTDAKNFALGQAYFMRGLVYFQLSLIYGDDVYGGIPIVDENTTEFEITRPEHVSESYAFAAQNFTKAAELLPYFEDINSVDYGKPHKNAALGYLARTHLHNAEFNNSSWSKVVEACDAVINSGKNALEPNFKDAFTIANNWGQEYLWSVPSNIIGGSIFPGASWENKGWGIYPGWGYFAPTLELYESYQSGDLRREATMLKYGDVFTYLGNERPYWSETNLTGFQFKKYHEPFTYAGAIHLSGNGAQHPTTDLNVPLLRYSHILLMKAEAQIMQGLNGDATLNMVRERAGLSPVSGATLDDLKYERRAEFVGELFGRYEDLCRWGDDAEIKAALHGRIHTDKSDPNSPYTVEEVWANRLHFDLEKHRIWPIPPQVLSTSNGTLSPNGW